MIALLVTAAAWGGAVVLVIALCRAAKVGDQRLRAQMQMVAELTAAEISAVVPAAERGEGLSVERPAPAPPFRVESVTARQGEPRAAASELRLSATEAAEILGVVTETLVAWEARYGYPRSTRCPGVDHDAYRVIEVMALATAMQSGLSVSAAVKTAMGVTARRFQPGHGWPSARHTGGAPARRLD